MDVANQDRCIDEKPIQLSDIGKKIVETCENHLLSQTNFVQEILSNCSKISGAELHCNQIVTFCNKIFSETVNNTQTIVNLCQSIKISDVNLYTLTPNIEDTKTYLPTSDETLNLKANISQCNPSTSKQDTATKEPMITIDESITTHEKTVILLPQIRSANTVTKPKFPSDDKQVDTEHTEHASVTETHEKVIHQLDELGNIFYFDDGLNDESKDNREGVTNLEEFVDGLMKTNNTTKKLLQKTTNAIYTCPFCDKKYKTKKSYKKHEKSHQLNNCVGLGNENNKKKVSLKDLKCEYCGKYTTTRKGLREHIRTHTGEKPYSCDICGSAFAQKSSLNSHQLIHTGSRSVACQLCNYTCLDQRRLKRHMITHTNEKPFKCEECGNRFARIASLHAHMNIHAGVKDYACDECNKKFVRRTDLMQHKKIHSDEMPYACEICGKRSRQAYNIVVHMRTHTGQKPFSCKTCGKKFAHNISLKQHKLSCKGDFTSSMIAQSKEINI